MGYDWVMSIMLQVKYIDRRDCHYIMLNSEETRKGIYLSYDDDDSDAETQMEQWKKQCPDTLVYENGSWISEEYVSPEWCGTSIRCCKDVICADINDLSTIARIKVIPYASRRY